MPIQTRKGWNLARRANFAADWSVWRCRVWPDGLDQRRNIVELRHNSSRNCFPRAEQTCWAELYMILNTTRRLIMAVQPPMAARRSFSVSNTNSMSCSRLTSGWPPEATRRRLVVGGEAGGETAAGGDRGFTQAAHPKMDPWYHRYWNRKGEEEKDGWNHSLPRSRGNSMNRILTGSCFMERCMMPI